MCLKFIYREIAKTIKMLSAAVESSPTVKILSRDNEPDVIIEAKSSILELNGIDTQMVKSCKYPNKIHTIKISNCNPITDFSFLYRFPNIDTIIISNTEINAPLIQLSLLSNLYAISIINHNQEINLSGINKIHGLQSLILCGDQFANIQSLTQIHHLTSLQMYANTSGKSYLFCNLPNLQRLTICSNTLEDYFDITNLTKLAELEITLSNDASSLHPIVYFLSTFLTLLEALTKLP